jgi:thioredoxin 1
MIYRSLALLVSLVFLTSACSDTSGKQTGDVEKPVKNVSENIKPEYLTYNTFLEKVWDFEKNPQEWVYRNELPSVIDFYADWCAPCRKIAPIMEKLAKDYEGRVKIYKINVDEERKLASVFRVQSIPAVLFTPVSGQPMMQAGAMTEEMYVQIIEEQLLKK